MAHNDKLGWSTGLPQPSGVRGFFAYPSTPPSIPPTVVAAIDAINRSQQTEIQGWESLRISGNYIIEAITTAIEEAQFFCADVTGINPNVMFELGYAVASDKRIWLVRDESYADTRKEFDQLRVLTTIGFHPYTNSDQLIKGFFRERPDEHLNETIWNSSIEPVLAKELNGNAVLYLKNLHETEASLQVTRAIEDARVPYLVSDPRETTVRPAYWFAQQLFDSPGLIAHFASSQREGYKLHNARYAFVCGMARGFGVPVLMLSEQASLLSPIDYRDAMQTYVMPSEANDHVKLWLSANVKRVLVLNDVKASAAKALKLATELRDFHVQLGDYVAENESNGLNEYFVETTVSADIINGTQNVFVGRKGAGKSANLIHAEAVIGSDTRNLVCVIRPLGYEIEGLVRLFTGYKVRDTKGYVIESLWKFMIYTELAQALIQQVEATELWQMNDPAVRELVDLVQDDRQAFAGDFAVRLERLVATLATLPSEDSAEQFRKGISEAVHHTMLTKLRLSIGRVLSKKRKVILLVDNLDKTWTKDADLTQLADFLLGLLTAASRVAIELNRAERDRDAIDFSSAIFLRSDIFERVQASAREPDKLSFTRLRWDDDELLLRVIEERYTASHGPASDASNMWKKYFCSTVRNVQTREYITSKILKRPRDIVYLVKAAVSNAVNRKHDRVEEKDITDAEREYGQYALDSILVENGQIVPHLEEILFAFSGGFAVLSETEVRKTVSRAGMETETVDDVINTLVKLSFLGLEIDVESFAFSEEPRELKQNSVLASRFTERAGKEKRYQVNPPFRTYLKISEQVIE